jgi:hypothetical protein
MSRSETPYQLLRRKQSQIRRDRELHFAIVVPDRRTFNYIVGKCFAVVPKRWFGSLHAHVVLNKTMDLSWQQRVTLADLKMVSHVELGLVEPIEVTLGWPETD